MSSTLNPSLDGDKSIGYRLEAESISTFLAASLAVALRLYSRARYAKLGWDDGIMLFALVLALLATVLTLIAIDRGLGRHLYYLTPWERQQQSKYNSLSQTFCIMSLCFCKVSICISLLRIIQTSRQRAMQWILYAIILLVLTVNVIVVITLYEQCRPVSKVWNRKIPGTCWAFPIELYVAIMQGAVSAFTDFLLSLLPIVIFQHLQIDKRSKIILCVLMSLGVFTGVIAIVRATQTGLSIRSSGNDSSYGAVLPLIWASLERNVAIMAASIPAARPLLQPFLQLTSRRLLRSWSKPTSQQSDQRSRPKIHPAPQGKHYENIELPNVGRSSRFGPPSWAVLRSQEDISPARQDV
ncbi:hypothetical protein MMC22_005700 [Lobaria immixta]|nr:hypothetical protein [Lobaria immixta]